MKKILLKSFRYLCPIMFSLIAPVIIAYILAMIFSWQKFLLSIIWDTSTWGADTLFVIPFILTFGSAIGIAITFAMFFDEVIDNNKDDNARNTNN